MFKQKKKFKGEGEMAALQRDLDVEGRQRLMPLCLCVFCFAGRLYMSSSESPWHGICWLLLDDWCLTKIGNWDKLALRLQWTLWLIRETKAMHVTCLQKQQWTLRSRNSRHIKVSISEWFSSLYFKFICFILTLFPPLLPFKVSVSRSPFVFSFPQWDTICWLQFRTISQTLIHIIMRFDAGLWWYVALSDLLAKLILNAGITSVLVQWETYTKKLLNKKKKKCKRKQQNCFSLNGLRWTKMNQGVN